MGWGAARPRASPSTAGLLGTPNDERVGLITCRDGADPRVQLGSRGAARDRDDPDARGLRQWLTERNSATVTTASARRSRSALGRTAASDPATSRCGRCSINTARSAISSASGSARDPSSSPAPTPRTPSSIPGCDPRQTDAGSRICSPAPPGLVESCRTESSRRRRSSPRLFVSDGDEVTGRRRSSSSVRPPARPCSGTPARCGRCSARSPASPSSDI